MMCKINYATIRKVNYVMCIFIGFSDNLKHSIIVIFNTGFFIKMLEKQI